MQQGYIVHFGEISLKGKNRSFFEKKLIENILEKCPNIKLKKKYGRLIIFSPNEEVENILKTTFGVANWSKAFILPLLDFDQLKSQVINLLQNRKDLLQDFKIEVKRSNKSYKPNSMEIASLLGAVILEKLGGKVNIKNPNNIIYIEIDDSNIYIYFDKNKGLGGLPIGTSGKIVSLISGGIDSPVAAYLMMKRGAEVILLHGYNERLDRTGMTKQKILNIAGKLADYAGELKIYFYPVADITRWILDNVELDYRMLIFKIILFKIANIVAEKEGALAISSGDNLAQVASQTLENLNIIYSFADKIVLPPLIGFDKQQIVDLAKDIGTYDMSINQKCEDVCSKISSKHPVTKANLNKVKNILDSFDSQLLDIKNSNIIVQKFLLDKCK